MCLPLFRMIDCAFSQMWAPVLIVWMAMSQVSSSSQTTHHVGIVPAFGRMCCLLVRSVHSISPMQPHGSQTRSEQPVQSMGQKELGFVGISLLTLWDSAHDRGKVILMHISYSKWWRTGLMLLPTSTTTAQAPQQPSAAPSDVPAAEMSSQATCG